MSKPIPAPLTKTPSRTFAASIFLAFLALPLWSTQISAAEPAVTATAWERLNKRYPTVAIRAALKQHYRIEKYSTAMLWHKNGSLTERGNEALNSLLLAEIRGISQPGLNTFVENIRAGKKSPAAADWLITARLINLNQRLQGINERRFSSVDRSSFHRSDINAALQDIIKTPRPSELLSLWRPRAPGFNRLAEIADQYEIMPAWPQLTGSGILSVGASDPEVIQLKSRLAAEGFVPDAGYDAQSFSYTDKFTNELSAQLENYQRNRGFATDGVLGPNTRQSLNVSPRERATQIRLNLARLQSLPAELGEQYVWVNIPEYKARVIVNDKTDFETKIVVGKNQHKTPIFIDQMDYLEVNPYWNIPRSIVLNEIAPKMINHPSHIDNQDMEILSGWSSNASVLDPKSIDWQAIADGSESLLFRIRQRPGNHNALGRVKFIFPNDHNVYLHDTPQDALFDRNKRNFSHGCVRLHKPFEMAEYVLQQRRYEPVNFREMLASEQPTRLSLDNPLPVYLVYFTTWVNEEGELQIRNDIYGHDQQLAEKLENERQQLISSGDYNDVIKLETEMLPQVAIRAPRKTSPRLR